MDRKLLHLKENSCVPIGGSAKPMETQVLNLLLKPLLSDLRIPDPSTQSACPIGQALEKLIFILLRFIVYRDGDRIILSS